MSTKIKENDNSNESQQLVKYTSRLCSSLASSVPSLWSGGWSSNKDSSQSGDGERGIVAVASMPVTPWDGRYTYVPRKVTGMISVIFSRWTQPRFLNGLASLWILRNFTHSCSISGPMSAPLVSLQVQPDWLLIAWIARKTRRSFEYNREHILKRGNLHFTYLCPLGLTRAACFGSTQLRFGSSLNAYGINEGSCLIKCGHFGGTITASSTVLVRKRDKSSLVGDSAGSGFDFSASGTEPALAFDFLCFVM